MGQFVEVKFEGGLDTLYNEHEKENTKSHQTIKVKAEESRSKRHMMQTMEKMIAADAEDREYKRLKIKAMEEESLQ